MPGFDTVQALEEWGDNVEQVRSSDPGADPADRFEATWDTMVQSFAENRALWAIQFELLTLIDRDPELRRTFVPAGRDMRESAADLTTALTAP